MSNKHIYIVYADAVYDDKRVKDITLCTCSTERNAWRVITTFYNTPGHCFHDFYVQECPLLTGNDNMPSFVNNLISNWR